MFFNACLFMSLKNIIKLVEVQHGRNDRTPHVNEDVEFLYMFSNLLSKVFVQCDHTGGANAVRLRGVSAASPPGGRSPAVSHEFRKVCHKYLWRVAGHVRDHWFNAPLLMFCTENSDSVASRKRARLMSS